MFGSSILVEFGDKLFLRLIGIERVLRRVCVSLFFLVFGILLLIGLGIWDFDLGIV